jgi:hypothetical protein
MNIHGITHLLTDNTVHEHHRLFHCGRVIFDEYPVSRFDTSQDVKPAHWWLTTEAFLVGSNNQPHCRNSALAMLSVFPIRPSTQSIDLSCE